MEKLCECGCGQPAPLAPHTMRKKGIRKGEPLRFIWGHNKQRLPDDAGVVGFCQCGCGGQTTLAERTVKRRGWKKGYPKRYLPGHSPKTSGPDFVVDENGCWLWQRSTNVGGY